MRRHRRDPTDRFLLPSARRVGPAPGPEVLLWYWHPNRFGSRPPPSAFAAQLRRIDPDLSVVFSPVHERWLVWVKEPRIQHPLCRGWKLLFLWEHPRTKTYLPLNELLFHNLLLIDATKYASAVDYYTRVQAGIDRARAARAADYDRERQAEQGDLADLYRISNMGSGNRAALHGDGTLVPSRGHQDWLTATRAQRLPRAFLTREQDDREKRAYGR